MKNKKITQQQQHTDISTEIVSYFCDHSSVDYDYSYAKLLLLKFMCSCTSTRMIMGQQHETVTTTTTTTTTTQSDLHKLLSVQRAHISCTTVKHEHFI